MSQSVNASVPATTDFDGQFFRTNALPISLVGSLTNWAKLATNQLQTGNVMVGTVSNAVASAGLLAVDSSKTNGIAATAAHIVSTLGFTPANSNSIPVVPTGIVSNAVASAGLLAVDSTKTNGVAATSAMVQAAAGQVWQATNANLTGWAAIPATSAGVQATLGEVYQATNTTLTSWAAIPATSAGVQATLGQVYQATNTVLTHYAGTDTNALLTAIGGVSKSGDTMTGTLGFSGSATLLNLPSLTTAQKNAATAIAGSQVYDSDLGRVQAYDGAAWHSRVRLDGDTMTGALVVPAGTAGAPSLGVGTTTNGVYSAGANTVGIATSGTGRWVVASDGTLGGATDGNYNIGTFATSRPLTITAVHVNSSDYFGFTGFGGYLRNPASQVYSFEVDAASPNNAALRGANGVGTDKNGGSLTLEGGQSTGTGRAGALIVRTATTSTTGSSANTYQERAHYVPKYVDLTDNTATTLFTVALPATNSVGIQFVCTIQASDGTDFQSLTTPVTVDAVAKTTTITAVVAPTAAQTAVAASSAATLSVTYTVVDAGSNVLAVKVTADTSFSSTTYLRAKIVMTAINGMGAGWSITEI